MKTKSTRDISMRLLAIAIAAVAAGLLAEGAGSLILGQSLIRPALGLSRSVGGPARMRMLDEERVRAAALSEGPFAGDLDPLVSIRLKGGLAYRFHDAVATTDPRGVRTRVGPPPDATAQRIIVLGDSVAFGYGLGDDDTIAHHLEHFLGGTMTSGVAPAAFTVACPGWTLANSRRFLLDRLDDIRPDIVVLMPIMNDLDDSYSIMESGHRGTDCDPARGVEFPSCSLTHHFDLASWLPHRFPSAQGMRNYVLYTGITPESKRRYTAAADGLLDLSARLAASGARLCLAALYEDAFGLRLAQELIARGGAIPFQTLFDHRLPEDALDGDPHPNRRCARAIAWRLARDLIARRWVRGAGERPLPPEDERYVGRAADVIDASKIRALEVEYTRPLTEEIGPRVDFDDGTGWHQVYGGVWPDGVVGNAAAVALSARRGTRLVVAVGRLGDRPGLYPASIRVFGNETLLGTIDLPAPSPGESFAVTRAIEVPAAIVQGGFLDVRLVSSGWMIETIGGISRLASFQLRSVSME